MLLLPARWSARRTLKGTGVGTAPTRPSLPGRTVTPGFWPAKSSGTPFLATVVSRTAVLSVEMPACMHEVSGAADAEPAVTRTALEASTAAAAIGKTFMCDSFVDPRGSMACRCSTFLIEGGQGFSVKALSNLSRHLGQHDQR